MQSKSTLKPRSVVRERFWAYFWGLWTGACLGATAKALADGVWVLVLQNQEFVSHWFRLTLQ